MTRRIVIVCLMAAMAAAQRQATLFAGDRLTAVVNHGGKVQVRGPLGDWPAETRLEGCTPDGAPEVNSTAAAVQVLRRLKGPASQTCSIVETFTPAPASLRWVIQVDSHGEF